MYLMRAERKTALVVRILDGARPWVTAVGCCSNGTKNELKRGIPEAVEVNLLVSPLGSEIAVPGILFPPAHKGVAG